MRSLATNQVCLPVHVALPPLRGVPLAAAPTLPGTHTPLPSQVSIRRGAHAEAYEVAPYSLTLLTKNEEAELYVGDHLQVGQGSKWGDCACVFHLLVLTALYALVPHRPAKPKQLLNPPFERLGCHALTLQLTILPTAADPAQEAAEHEQGASSATQAAAASSEAAPAKTLRQGSGLIARPPVPLFFPPLTAEGAGGSGRIAASGTDDEQDHEEEDEDEERDEEPSLSERGLAAVFASPPLVGVAGAMRPPSQTSLLGVGRKQQGGAQPTPALPPLPPPAQETLPKGRRPRAEESDGGEGEGEEEEGGAMGGMAKRARPAEQEQEAAVAMDVAEAENKKRRGSLGDALMAPLGGWISSLFTSGSKRAAGRAIDDDQQLGSKKRRTTTAAMEEEEAVVPE